MIIKCAHGDVVLYPLANVDMEVDGLKVKVEAAVSGRLPYYSGKMSQSSTTCWRVWKTAHGRGAAREKQW